ncbi:RHS repeat-associated core domain-containing protein, partial [Comamonas sp. MYb21]|uniref:RHS repeat-associated core domain-containing protein n=1 Tax=Comamonas sp. MYb21 TaxID=1848648 RepID=UPI0030B496E1
TSQREEAAQSIEIRHYLCDHLGTPHALIREDTRVEWAVQLDAWGNVRVEHNPSGLYQPIRLPGQHADEDTGHYYNRYRYYEPKIGCYINQDPIGLFGGINTFAYSSAGPLVISDPLGLAGCIVNFPDYPIDTGYGFSLNFVGGHSGVLSYDASGATRYYEFGRYNPNNPFVVGHKRPEGEGNVRRISVPDLVMDPETREPTAASLEKLEGALSERAGKKTKTRLTCDNNADEEKINNYANDLANDQNRPPYSLKIWSSNQCRDFASRALDAGKR